jgi:hypothetical protein
MPELLKAILLLAILLAAAAVPLSCPDEAQTRVAEFELNGTQCISCEDLQRRDGTLALVCSNGDIEWFEKGYEPYTQGSDDEYYLNLTKQVVMGAKADILAVKLLSANYTHLSYELVKSAVPPMRSTGVRTFVGSRAASVDTSLGDLGNDANGYGFPSISAYVINLTAIHAGEPAIDDFHKHINTSYVADGQLGGHLPIVRFSFPVSRKSPYLPKGENGSRHWDMIAAGVPDMKGSREQSVWFRFQQTSCADSGVCSMIGSPQYFGRPFIV